MAEAAAIRSAQQYLATVDRVLPGRVTGFYVVGSTALGAFVPGRSDIDFVAVVEADQGTDLGADELRRLREVHVRSGLRTGAASVRRGWSPLAGTCNGVYLRRADLTTPVREIVPLAGHIGHTFHVGAAAAGSDVSPVGWQVLAERGIALRGEAPAALGLDPEPAALAAWNVENLDQYWRRWAAKVTRSPKRTFALRPRYWTSWGMLGAPRLHHTIATGNVISKEAAGEHALEVFPAQWHPLIEDALAYVRRRPNPGVHVDPAARATMTGAFVLHVAAAADELAASRAADAVGDVTPAG